jgi:hypothetical protein
MSGGITQLVAIGAQDAFIVGNPEVSFFQSNYKRHTNFSHVVHRQVIQGNPSAGSMSTVRFERKGDMLSYVYLTKKSSGSLVTIDDNDIQYVELLIGGQVVDKQYYDFSVNVADPLLVTTQNKAVSTTANNKFYPLHFWFCESWQSALPLVALQYHDVEIRITWGSSPGASIYECWADYIYLDTAERVSMASKPQNILMYQVQTQSASGTAVQPLVFNHPVKFLACSGDLLTTSTATIKLQLNGTDIGDEKLYDQHSNTIPFYYHCPNSSLSYTSFLYPFCLDTSKIQPSGSLNFSRIDSARFVSSTGDTFSFSNYIYAVNYNVLKVENGMGGLMYAN